MWNCRCGEFEGFLSRGADPDPYPDLGSGIRVFLTLRVWIRDPSIFTDPTDSRIRIWIRKYGSTIPDPQLFYMNIRWNYPCVVTWYCIDSPLLPLPIETNIMRLLKPSIQVEGSSPAPNKTFSIKNSREGVWDLKLELNHVTCHHHQNITLKKKRIV